MKNKYIYRYVQVKDKYIYRYVQVKNKYIYRYVQVKDYHERQYAITQTSGEQPNKQLNIGKKDVCSVDKDVCSVDKDKPDKRVELAKDGLGLILKRCEMIF